MTRAATHTPWALLPALLVLLLTSGCSSSSELPDDSATVQAPSGPHGASAAEQALLDAVDPDRLSDWHDLLASAPHRAGTPGDRRVVDVLVQAFTDMGLEVERHEFHALLARPISASVSVVSPVRVDLSLKEDVLAEDRYSAHPDLDIGWNAYSASGVVTAEVVYANHGTKQDFERLKALGVSCEGRIVLARYGGNFRGYKAKFAEAAGAAGLILFTDPKDSGWVRGLGYPEGGFAHPSHIQRGSILTLPWTGDPLTPFFEATADAVRLDPDELALPKIPVQPMSWSAAHEILSRMTGSSVPNGWQGGLPFRYRLTGGPELRVRLAVEQRREIVPTWNVLATLRGSEEPEREVIIGSHHDAWCCGAVDPACGLICVLEAARAFVSCGWQPRRSITFAAWGAEEFGIIGSSEWVEANEQRLRDNAVAYFNLDAAVTGPHFGASASPSLQRLIAEVTGAVAAVDDGANGQLSVLDDWRSRSSHAGVEGLPSLGDLGGGSDFVTFLARAGVPCASLSAGGSAGTAYHGNHDTLAWYRQVVGDDYEPARMVTQITALLAARLADAPLLPLDPAMFGIETRRHLSALTTRGREIGLFEPGPNDLADKLQRLGTEAVALQHTAQRVTDALSEDHAAGLLSNAELASANRILLAIDRAWLDEQGLPDRPWFINLFAAPDEDSGYAPWMLPALRWAIEHQDAEALAEIELRYAAVFERMQTLVGELDSLGG
jgi:N-acetylated-alpha-linked acidic dipeptidase